MKQKKKWQKIASSFTSPDFFLNFFCYEVIVKQKKTERGSNYY